MKIAVVWEMLTKISGVTINLSVLIVDQNILFPRFIFCLFFDVTTFLLVAKQGLNTVQPQHYKF